MADELEKQNIQSFVDLNLHERLLRGISAAGYHKPDEPQQQVLPPVFRAQDTIVDGEVGRNKNLITAITSLHNVELSINQCQAMVLCATRESAQQVYNMLDSVGKFMNIKCHACVGGRRINEDIKDIQGGIHVIVGTPGRVESLVGRGIIMLNALKIIIIDEADEILSRGFADQIDSLHQNLPSKVQVIIFSRIKIIGTDIVNLVTKYTNDPVQIHLDMVRENLDGIKNFHITVEREDMKINALLKFINDSQIAQTIVFCRTVEKGDLITKRLVSEVDYTVSSMHEDMQQHEQDEVWKSYRSGLVRIIVTSSASSVSRYSRQVSSVALIINYDLPVDVESYVLLSGRGGRFGRKAVVVNLLVPTDHDMKGRIEDYYSTTILPLPEDTVNQI